MKSQRGGFFVGMIVGLLIGLALALAVALYVTKAPVPFVNKVPQRSPEQDAAEAAKNKNWDPNAPLAGKNPARPASVPEAAPSSDAAPAVQPSAAPSVTAGKPANKEAAAAAPADKSAAPSTAAAPDAFVYFVQAGAYSHTEEAEAQRAKLAMLGLQAKITEREQNGRTVYRVRVGPYEQRTDAEAAKDKIDGNGVGDTALVRVQKP